MTVAEELRFLAERLERYADSALAQSEKNPDLFKSVLKTVAEASFNIEKAAINIEQHEKNHPTEDALERLAVLANDLDETGDPELMKKATVLDEILLGFGAPKNSLAQMRQQSQDELDKITEKYRRESGDQLYRGPKEALDKMNMVSETRKAVNDQVKRYRPLEAPLQTRYSPDTPGEPMMRVSDHVYQSVLTGKIYDYRNGYTTDKGNKIPGTSVDRQTPDLGSQPMSRSIFDTRQSVLSRYAGVKSVLDEIRK